ncbi:MAG: methyltransferase domain-containing protein [Pseudonocardiaceae bacterium]|nr:methyltransferase domain-containing protein [Pseudonocardiaceae bacterium]
MGQMVGNMTGGALCFSIWVGDELGLYGALAGGVPLSADEVATETRCHPRLVREWLDSQAAGGLIDYDDKSDSYTMSAESAAVLADDTSPTFVARAMAAFGAFFSDIDKVTAAYRGTGGLAWGEHHPRLFEGTEWFFRTGYRAELPNWLQGLDGVHDRLVAGAQVADIGCGHGASVVVMAENYPNSQITGFDSHRPSIDTARLRANEAGTSGNTHFEVAEAKSYSGTFDLICFFDCLHDMGDPVGIARYAREHLTDDGAVLLVEPFAVDGRAANLAGNPMAALLYTASATVCTPNSLSQEVGLGLGAQAGEGKLREVFEEAGYTRFRRIAETPLNLILEARA